MSDRKLLKNGIYPVSIENMPKYDFFLSQVIDFLNEYFPEEHYTNNIIQNYIKSEIISKPFEGKKRGYAKYHLIQLVLVSYLRPVLTTDEIKKVFSLAFNDINDNEDDLISWEEAYKIFLDIFQETIDNTVDINDNDSFKINSYLKALNLKDSDKERIATFIEVLILITRASIIKKKVKSIVDSSII